jgi:hypothetical protein
VSKNGVRTTYLTQLAVRLVLLPISLLSAGFTAYGQSSDEPMGSICGMVQDENGVPASLVKVTAVYVGPKAHTGPYARGETDGVGRYCIHVTIGDYIMSADDVNKGYPLMAIMFYASHDSNAQSSAPGISITAEELTRHVDWRIPYKAGFVTVKLTDARTGKQIVPMFFDLVVRSRPEDGHMHGSRASTAALLVPPNEDIGFAVSAPGYQWWPGDDKKGKLMNLLPGTTEEVAIELQPTTPQH